MNKDAQDQRKQDRNVRDQRIFVASRSSVLLMVLQEHEQMEKFKVGLRSADGFRQVGH